MEPMVEVFLIQEGRDPNPSGKAYLAVPAAESVAALGLSHKLEHHPSKSLALGHRALSMACARLDM